jgi:hypothetical protein
MKAPPRRGYADQVRSLKLSKALRASRALFEDPHLYGRRLPGKRQPIQTMTVIARAALLLSALAGCAVVFIRYTLAPPRVRPDVY